MSKNILGNLGPHLGDTNTPATIETYRRADGQKMAVCGVLPPWETPEVIPVPKVLTPEELDKFRPKK